MFDCCLQEVSLLADLVARALSGLDIFSEADGRLSPTVFRSIVGAGGLRVCSLCGGSSGCCKTTTAERSLGWQLLLLLSSQSTIRIACSCLLFWACFASCPFELPPFVLLLLVWPTAAGGQLQGASSSTASVVPRKQTLREGLYSGLQGKCTSKCWTHYMLASRHCIWQNCCSRALAYWTC